MVNGRRTLPRTIARGVLANLHQSLVPMIYTTVSPGVYVVYLHREDFAEIEGIVPALSGQISRALDDALERLERPRWWDRVLHPARDRMPPLETGVPRMIHIMPDPNGDLERGQVGVHSELRLPTVEYAGVPTVRVTATTTASAGAERRDVPLTAVPMAASAVLAIEDLDGQRSHPLVDNPTLVGRGGLGCYVHVRLRTEGVVSKEHCRIRRDEAGDFFIKDLSRNGTFVDGERLPAGVDYSNGQKREIDAAETRLPDGASIRLADALSLEFRRAKT